MYLKDIIEYITNICIYYYKEYNKKVNNREIVIPSYIYYKIRDDIYNIYSSLYTDCYVEDIMVLDDIFGKQYDLNNEDIIDIYEIYDIISDYINNYQNMKYNISIPIISISHSLIDNYIVFDSLGIKLTIDQYLLG